MLDHLLRMTDNTVIFQNAIFNVPNFAEGYCTDDNARAFIRSLLLEETTSLATHQQFQHLASIYLAFLWNAFDQETGRFRNFMSHQRHWLEREGSEDSHARALWATGTALGRSKNEGHRNLCALLFQRGLPPVENFTSPRAWAFTLLDWAAGRTSLLRVVSRSQRSGTVTLRFEHGWLSRCVASRSC